MQWGSLQSVKVNMAVYHLEYQQCKMQSWWYCYDDTITFVHATCFNLTTKKIFFIHDINLWTEMLSGYLSALTSNLCQDKSTYETYEIKKQISLKSINEYLILFLITLWMTEEFCGYKSHSFAPVFDIVEISAAKWPHPHIWLCPLFGWFWLAFELKLLRQPSYDCSYIFYTPHTT